MVSARTARCVVVLHEVFGVNARLIRESARNWPSKASSELRQNCTGVKRRVSTSTYVQSQTGNMVFASIKPTIGTPGLRTLKTPSPPWPSFLSALARLRS